MINQSGSEQPLSVESRWMTGLHMAHQALEGLAIRGACNMALVMNRCWGHRSAESLGILMYHRVFPEIAGLPRPSINVPPQQFRQQIAGLVARGYTVWPLKQVCRYARQGKSLPDRVVVITFDDGYENVYLHAWPVLREFGVPATVFVSTAYLDSQQPFPFDHWGLAQRNRAPAEAYRPLTRQQCHQLVDEGLVDLGAHTHTHQDFRRRPQMFRSDLQQSVDFLKCEFGMDEVAFAFPYGTPQTGFAGPELVAAAKETGVICGLTTESVMVDPRSDPFRWGRFNTFAWDTGATVAAKLAGWYSWAPRQKYRLLRWI